MRVESHIEYLGMLLGQNAAATQWTKPSNKVQHRLVRLGLSHDSITQNIIERNTRIQPVLSYKLQFVDPPCALVNGQDSIITKVFRFPRGAAPTWAGVHVDELAPPAIVPIECCGLAIVTRFAWKTCCARKEARDRTRRAAEDLAGVVQATGPLAPSW